MPDRNLRGETTITRSDDEYVNGLYESSRHQVEGTLEKPAEDAEILDGEVYGPISKNGQPAASKTVEPSIKEHRMDPYSLPRDNSFRLSVITFELRAAKSANVSKADRLKLKKLLLAA